MSDARIVIDEMAKRGFGSRTVKGEHSLLQTGLFSDDALARLLDRHPREFLFALTMGSNPDKPEENRLASIEGVSGDELLEAVRRGRFWLNVTRVDRFEPAYRALLDELFAQLRAKVPSLVCDGSQATLLISSPTAQVYYHADAAPTVLWHLRGRKRIWVYPLEERFLARADQEEILAGVRHEYLPYDRRFDDSAEVHDLEPGQWVTWPQNCPHRVVNLEGLNVSLSSEFFTPQSRQRARVYGANRFLRTLGLRGPSAEVDGPRAMAKVVFHQIARQAGLETLPSKRHVVACRVDPSSPTGVAPLRSDLAPGPLTVRCFQSFEGLAPLRSQIAALNARSRLADPFSTLEFMEKFIRHDEFEAREVGRELWFLAAFEGERLVGYLALQRRKQRAFGREFRAVEFLLTRDCDRPHLVCRPGDEQACARAFVGYLASRRKDWSLLELKQQDARSPLRSLLVREPPRGYHVREFPSMENGTIPLRWSSLAEYFHACSKKHRNNLARASRAVLGAGEVLYLSSDDPAVTPDLLELYATIEPRSWKSLAQGTITRHEKRMAFFRSQLAADNPMRFAVAVLLLEGVPIAGLIDGRFGETQYALQNCYDASREELAPGAVMLLMGVRRAIAEGCREYNLMSGFGYYKTRFLAEMTETRSVQLFRIGSLPHLKSKLGEVRRLVGPRDNAAKYNEVRRRVEQERGGVLPVAPLTEAERARVAQLVAKVRAGRCEVLDNQAFARAMPFATNVAPPRAPSPRRSGAHAVRQSA